MTISVGVGYILFALCVAIAGLIGVGPIIFGN